MNTQHSRQKNKRASLYLNTKHCYKNLRILKNIICTLQLWPPYNFIKLLKHYQHHNEKTVCLSDFSSLLISQIWNKTSELVDSLYIHIYAPFQSVQGTYTRVIQKANIWIKDMTLLTHVLLSTKVWFNSPSQVALSHYTFVCFCGELASAAKVTLLQLFIMVTNCLGFFVVTYNLEYCLDLGLPFLENEVWSKERNTGNQNDP